MVLYRFHESNLPETSKRRVQWSAKAAKEFARLENLPQTGLPSADSPHCPEACM